MKTKVIRLSSLVSAIFVVASAVLLSVIIFLCVIGMLNPRKVTIGIVTDSASKMYDGTPLISSYGAISYGNLIDGHEIVFLGSNEIVGVGTMENALDFIIVDSTGADVTNMYNTNITYGTLTVTKRYITLQSESKGKVYDGTPLTSSELALKKGSFVKGDVLHVMGENSIIEVGGMENVLSYYISDSSGADVTDYYQVTYNTGILQIRPQTVTIKTSSATKTYDGSPLSLSEWSIVNGSFGSDENVYLDFPALDTVGKIENKPTMVVVTDAQGKEITSRYNIKFSSGSLCIMPIALIVETGSAKKIYDGKSLSNTQWTIATGKLLAGHTAKALAFPQITNAGIMPNNIPIAIVDSFGRDVTNLYSLNYRSGDLTIQPRPITISTGSARKKYDGKPLSSNSATIQSGSLLSGHSMVFSGSQRTEVGTSQNIQSGIVIFCQDEKGNREDVTNNYKITYSYGTLTVTK